MSETNLAKILENTDTKKCLEFFRDMSEKGRQKLAKFAFATHRQIESGGWTTTPFGDDMVSMSYTEDPRMPVAVLSLWCTCSLGAIKKLGFRMRADNDLVYEILANRKAPWLDDWAAWVCERFPGYWPVVRRLVREGICRKPAGDAYIRAMIRTVCPFDAERTMYDCLLADRELLKDDLWRIFEVQGNTWSSLAGQDNNRKNAENTWTAALVRLSREKKLPRKRLLNAGLSALMIENRPVQAAWFSRFHEALEPTLPERAERASEYLDLLAIPVASTVSFALGAVSILAKNDRVTPDAVLASIGPALLGRHKGPVQQALGLLEEISERHPKSRGKLAHVLADALSHPSPDIHKKALDVLEICKTSIDGSLAQLLRERLDHVAASQRARLLGLLAFDSTPLVEASAPPEFDAIELRRRAAALPPGIRESLKIDALLAALDSGTADVAAVEIDPMKIPRLLPARRITPIETVDELLDSAGHVVENRDDADEFERVLDGVSRLCGERSADFESRSGPLRKRVRDVLNGLYSAPFLGFGPGLDLCAILHAWLTGEVMQAVKKGQYQYNENIDVYVHSFGKRPAKFYVSRYPSVAMFQSLRWLELAQRCAERRALPLLSAPTHRGGWIDPTILAERALTRARAGQDLERFDQIQSLLRLSPDGRAAAKKRAAKVPGEFGAAFRYALGGDEPLGNDEALWIAACRARDPFGSDAAVGKRFPDLGPNAAEASVYRFAVEPIPGFAVEQLGIRLEPLVPDSARADLVTVLLNPRPQRNGHWHPEIRMSVDRLRSLALVWPIQREAWFAAWARPFAGNLDWWVAAWTNRLVLEPLLDPHVPLDDMARLMLTLGLSAKNPGEHGLATDALIAAIDDGRFHPDRFGETLAALWPLLKAARLARTLSQAASVSTLHRHLVNRAVIASLCGDVKKTPRDFSSMLEFLNESLIESQSGLDSPTARTFLLSFASAGKAGRLARQLLAREASEINHAPILLRALSQRLERASS